MKHSSGALLIQGHGFVYKCLFFCTSSSQRWFPSTTRSNHLKQSIPGLFPVGGHESGLSHLRLLRWAKTMKTQSSKSFHGFSAELSHPLCSLQKIYLLSIREADRAALKALTCQDVVGSCCDPPRTSPAVSGRWSLLFPHQCRKWMVLTCSWLLQGFREVLWNRP